MINADREKSETFDENLLQSHSRRGTKVFWGAKPFFPTNQFPDINAGEQKTKKFILVLSMYS